MTLQDETATQDVTTAASVVLTDGAAAKVKGLLEQEGRTDLALRVAVQPGGCSGLRYQLFFDERSLDGDVVTDFGGVNVVVDRMSAPYLSGATIDFVDTIEKQGFTIDNPNAQRRLRLRRVVQLVPDPGTAAPPLRWGRGSLRLQARVERHPVVSGSGRPPGVGRAMRWRPASGASSSRGCRRPPGAARETGRPR